MPTITTSPKATLPREFLQRLARLMPEINFSQCITQFSEASPLALHVNTLKTTREQLEDNLLQQGCALSQVPWHPALLLAPADEWQKITKTTAYLEGLFSLQGLSDTLPVMVLDPKPHDNVLDMTAAPGNKAFQMACLMKNQGHITAIEIIKSRFIQLKQEMQSFDAHIVDAQFKDSGKIWKYSRGRYDKVLLDPPCTAESTFKLTEPDSYSHWSVRKIDEMQAKQRRLLFAGLQCLKPGGELVYTSNTFAPEENEYLIERVMEKFAKTIEIETIEVPVENVMPGLCQWGELTMRENMKKAVRIMPNIYMGGLFICKLKKILA